MTGRQEEEIVDEFPMAVLDGIRRAAGGELTPEAMQRLTADEITLWGYAILREEVMDGGFVQLIHNGYGPFFFFNPFAKAMRLWGIDELARLMKKAGTLSESIGNRLPGNVPTRSSWLCSSNIPSLTTWTTPS